MSVRVEAIVKAELLAWGRRSAGIPLELAARKIGVSPARLAEWEAGVARPSVAQLRSLASAYRRPLAAFYLPAPPEDYRPLHDFRRKRENEGETLGPEARFALRRAHQRRLIALELVELLGETAPAFDHVAKLDEDPEELGARIRDTLGLTEERQREWRQPYDVLKGWRSAIEALGVLVFQFSGVSTKELRGFSISEFPLPTIVVNVQDSPRGRVFTMLHELVHVLLRADGVCDLSEDGGGQGIEDEKVEVFCNRVAGTAYVPAGPLKKHPQVRAHPQGSLKWSDDEVESIARTFGCSREVLLRRLLLVGLTSQDFYQLKRRQLMREYAELEKRPSEGFVPPHVKALSNAGSFFSQLVLTSFHREKITSSDVAEYLDVRLKHLPKIEAELSSRAGPRGIPA